MRKNTMLQKLLVLVLALAMVMGLSITSLAKTNDTITATVTVEIQDDEDANTFVAYEDDFTITPDAGSSLMDAILYDDILSLYAPNFSYNYDDGTYYMDSFYGFDDDMDYYGYYSNGDIYTYGYGWSFFVEDSQGNLVRPIDPALTRASDGAKWWKAIDEYVVQNGDHIVLRYGYAYTRSDIERYVLDFQWLLYGQVAN